MRSPPRRAEKGEVKHGRNSLDNFFAAEDGPADGRARVGACHREESAENFLAAVGFQRIIL